MNTRADGIHPAHEDFADDVDLADQVSTRLVQNLMGSTGYDSIHHAACMLEYLSEVESEYLGESSPSGNEGENLAYGRWLVNVTIGNLLRTGLAQLKDEFREATDASDTLQKAEVSRV